MKRSKEFLLKVILPLLIGLTLTACGGGGGTAATDTTAPTVSSVMPSDGATDVATNIAITTTFSEAMDSSTITSTTFTLDNGVTGTVTYDSATKTATLTPSANLTYSTIYVATITTGAADAAGNAVAADHTWTFTTAAEPVYYYTVSATVNGLSGTGLVLQNNSGDDLAIDSGDGYYTFSAAVADGAAYAVTVLTNPTNLSQICTVNTGTGTIASADITDVTVTCSTNSYTVGGKVTGLTFGTLVLQNNAGDDLTITADGAFTFATDVADGANSDVTTLTAPVSHYCTVTNGSGTLNGATITDVAVECNFVEVFTLYTANGADWNDYVVNDGADVYSATDTACTGAETGGYDACIHSGEKRVVEVPTYSSCTGLTATDFLGAFDWTCDSSTNPVRMVSTGLKETKNLSDLLDFATPGWLANSVIVSDGGTELFTTAGTWWWGNVVESPPGSGNLSTEGTVYVVTTNPSNSYTIIANKVALVVKPGTTITGGGTTGETIIYAASLKHLWLEGIVDVTGDNNGVSFNNVDFSVLRGVGADNSSFNGIALSGGSDNNKLYDITSSNNSQYGIYVDYSLDNSVKKVTANGNYYGLFIKNSSGNLFSDMTTGNNNYGVYLLASTDNTISKLNASNNTSRAIELFNQSNSNTFTDINLFSNTMGIYLENSNSNIISDLAAVNNTGFGIHLAYSSNNIMYRLLSLNNGSIGIVLDGSLDNVLSQLTVANNDNTGIYFRNGGNHNNVLKNVTIANNNNLGLYLKASSDNTVINLNVSNNATNGIVSSSSSNNTYSNVVGASNNVGLYFDNSSDNYFTGYLKVSNGCIESGGTNPGFDNSTCATNGSSDATLITNVSVSDSFLAEVTSDDASNASDSDGTALYDDIADWILFENSYRGWGNYSGIAFPDAGHQGVCSTGETCQIWDWSLASGDTGDAGNPVLKDVLTLPNGGNTLSHTWSDTSTTTFLRNAVEIMDDGIGNDDLLCESGESCIFTPNIASYQGHGSLMSAGSFTGGTLTGITLMEYGTNGY